MDTAAAAPQANRHRRTPDGFSYVHGVLCHERPDIYAPRPALAATQRTALHPAARCRLHDLLRAVALASGLKLADIKSARRFLPLVHARFVYFHLARVHTAHTPRSIGYYCGNRDRTTVLNGLEVVAAKTELYADFIADAKSCLAELLEAQA